MYQIHNRYCLEFLAELEYLCACPFHPETLWHWAKVSLVLKRESWLINRWEKLIVFHILKYSFTKRDSSRRENINDENPVAFLKINNATVLHKVFLIKTKLDCVLLRGITSD